jgi:CRP-like cAMP-binding protein
MNGDFTEDKRQFIKKLGPDEYFGEVALMTNLKRTAFVRALDICSFTFLSYSDFNLLKKELPHIYNGFRDRIKQRYSDPDL